MRPFRRRKQVDTGEFLWLTSLSDLMILLFVFFVMLFSFAIQKVKKSDMERILSSIQNKKLSETPTQKMEDSLNQWIQNEKLGDTVKVTQSNDAVVLEVKDRVFFESGSYQLKASSLPTIKSLSLLLTKIPESRKISIEGHTDDTPISSSKIHDNWELSSLRAIEVLRELNLPDLIKRKTSAVAFGDQVPILPNRDDKGNPLLENQSQNRRVTFRIY